MARVIVSREARNDLVSIRDYIRDELCNPDAARRILAQLKKSVSSLEHHPGRGNRYLICENYCVFYVCMESTVLVVRILHQRQDSFRALFLSE